MFLFFVGPTKAEYLGKPKGGPVSPDGLDWGPLSSPKTASLVGSIGHGRPIESCGARMATQDDPLAAKMAEGTRSASARGRVSLVTFFARTKKVTRSSRSETKGSNARDNDIE